MGETAFKLYIKDMNLEEKKELIRYIFNSYIKLAQTEFKKLSQNSFYSDYPEDEDIDYQRYFKYTIQEKTKPHFEIESEEMGFYLYLEDNNEIRGLMSEYDPITWATSINDTAKKINESLLEKYKKNIIYMNISTELLNILDQGNGNEYFNSLDTFFKILKDTYTKLNFDDSTETKNNLLKFLKQENVIENDAINLIGNDKYPIRKKIYDYLWNNKIITKKTTQENKK